MVYRREIDGLRAVAVLPVILFHGGVTIFSGGFVGVDVFFVISGYLITSIILNEIRDGRFSILTFYERRARRILPALCCVALCTLPFALFWMYPSQQREYARSLVAVFLFVSNIFFWRESGYFATEAEELPMLHTWSLAVEEQYYLFFPLLLVLLWARARRATFWVLLALTLASLVLCQLMSQREPTANFYLIPTRAWELFIGSLCAFILSARPGLRNEGMSMLGLMLIIVAIFAIDDRTPFPSLYALAPTLGTAAIILFAQQGTLVARLLSVRGLVGIGLISYSAYLWHQPLFAFARIRSIDPPGPMMMFGLVLLSLVLSVISWRFIEQPFRRRASDAAGRKRALTVSAVVSFIFITIGMSGIGSSGLFGGRFTNLELFAEIDEQVKPSEGLQPPCTPDEFDGPSCRTGNSPEIAVWGDSFAAHLIEGVIASAPNVPIAQATFPRCGPFLDAAPYSARLGKEWSENCIAHNARVINWLRGQTSVKYVVLSSPFRAYLSEDWKLLTPEGIRPSSPELAIDLFKSTLTAIENAGKQVVVVSPTPQSGLNIGRCLARSVWLDKKSSNCDFPLSGVAPITLKTDAFLKEIAKTYRVIWLKDGICPDGVCRAMIDGSFLYFDHGHLTAEGSRDLGRRMGWGTLIRSLPQSAPPT